jgi:hypothetical protein
MMKDRICLRINIQRRDNRMKEFLRHNKSKSSQMTVLNISL